MGAWFDFIMVALAVGLGWLGWMLFSIARWVSPQALRRQTHARAYSLSKDQVFRFK